jgi:hypothetical protein
VELARINLVQSGMKRDGRILAHNTLEEMRVLANAAQTRPGRLPPWRQGLVHRQISTAPDWNHRAHQPAHGIRRLRKRLWLARALRDAASRHEHLTRTQLAVNHGIGRSITPFSAARTTARPVPRHAHAVPAESRNCAR